MKSIRLSWWARIGVLFFLAATPITHISAQQHGSGRLRGHVVDSEGATIRGAVVFVHKQGPGEDSLRMAAHTDLSGDFMLRLEGGGYDILVTAPGFAAAVLTIPVVAGKTRLVEWKLKALACNFPGMNCDTFQ